MVRQHAQEQHSADRAARPRWQPSRADHQRITDQTFEEFGLPVRWSEDDSGVALGMGGGKGRIASLLTLDLVTAASSCTTTVTAMATHTDPLHQKSRSGVMARDLAALLD